MDLWHQQRTVDLQNQPRDDSATAWVLRGVAQGWGWVGRPHDAGDAPLCSGGGRAPLGSHPSVHQLRLPQMEEHGTHRMDPWQMGLVCCLQQNSRPQGTQPPQQDRCTDITGDRQGTHRTPRTGEGRQGHTSAYRGSGWGRGALDIDPHPSPRRESAVPTLEAWGFFPGWLALPP
jgi:hypothetical protein